MKNRNSKFETRISSRRPSPRRAGFFARFLSFQFRVSLLVVFLVFLAASCGVPAEPHPPRPVIPEAVTDLAVRQRGDGGLLTFTPPAKSTEGDKLDSPPSMEILRGFAPASAQSPPSGSLRVVYTVPGPVLDTYLSGDRVEFQDPIPPDEIVRHSGQRLFYIVRGRASKRATSEDSNAVSFVVHPAPAPIQDVRVTVTEAGVQLNWEPPESVTGGAPVTNLGSYRIFRSERLGAAGKGAALQPPVLAGVSPSPSYLDSQIEWGKTYEYTVRSVAQYGADAVESADSHPLEVTAKDVFPPASPLELVCVFVPAAGASPAAVELSWAISPEPDTAGYYVYRTGEREEKRQRITPSLLPTPAFRDISITPGTTYQYFVTAVDRSGNESQLSKPVAIRIPGAGD